MNQYLYTKSYITSNISEIYVFNCCLAIKYCCLLFVCVIPCFHHNMSLLVIMHSTFPMKRYTTRTLQWHPCVVNVKQLEGNYFALCPNYWVKA